MVFFFRFLFSFIPMLLMRLPVYYSVRGMSLPWPLAHRLLIKQLQVLKHVSFIMTIIFRNKFVFRVI